MPIHSVRNPIARAILVCAMAGLISGPVACTSAVESGHNTLLDSKDLNAMTSEMSASILASSKVQAIIAANGPLKVVCEPVENDMTGVILPEGQAQAYTAEIRNLLSQQAPNKFIWIMNRDEFYALRAREVDAPLGPSPDAINPQYALLGRFQTLSQEDEKHRTDFYLCSYRLTSLDHRTIIWQSDYRVKKTAINGFLD